MAASSKDKRTPITTRPYQVPSVDFTPDPPSFSLDTTFNVHLNFSKFFDYKEMFAMFCEIAEK
jgi:hypothetical protein